MRNFFVKIIALNFYFFLLTSCSNNPSFNVERDYLDMQDAILEAFINVKDSSVIQIPDGHYLFSKSLILDGKKNVTIRGNGMEKTVLSFKGQTQGAEGLRIANCENITIENMTVEDSNGDNIKVTDTDGIIFKQIRSVWTGEVSTENGAYAIYPVLCNNVLIEESEAIGASDAGIYVGQSDNVIIRNNKAYYNVAGIESENSTNVEIYGNEAYENTGGLLIFNLPGLTKVGSDVNVFKNHIFNNNLKNFGVKGSIVSTVPSGSGLIILATKNVEINNNIIENHKTANTSIVSYELFASNKRRSGNDAKELPGGVRRILSRYKEDDSYDPFSGKVYIHDNIFNNNMFPDLRSEYGKLWALKNSFSIPDIVFDGIYPNNYLEMNEEVKSNYKICINENQTIEFAVMDASNDFKNFSNDISNYNCEINE